MATYSGWGLDLPFTAGEDLTGFQYCFVKCGSIAGTVESACVNAEACIGVLQNDPAYGQEAQVRVMGISKLFASSSVALTYGGNVKNNASGYGTGYAYTSQTGCLYLGGIALEALASGCAVVEILVTPYRRYHGA